MLVDVRFEALDGGKYAVYALYDPAINNSGRHDAAFGLARRAGRERGGIASALVADEPFSAVSNGYLGTSDGWTDLAADHGLNWRYPSAPDGNVVQTARLALDGQRDAAADARARVRHDRRRGGARPRRRASCCRSS